MRELKKPSLYGMLVALVAGRVYRRGRKPAPAQIETPIEAPAAGTLERLPAAVLTPVDEAVVSTYLYRVNRLDIIVVLALMLLAAVSLHNAPPLPVTPPRDAAFLFEGLLNTGVRWSRVFAVLLVPALYGLGWQFDGRLTGIVAAGFAAASGWALALGQSNGVYSALAFFAALSPMLLRAQDGGGFFLLVWFLLTMFVSWSVSPLLAGTALLLPVYNFLYLRDQGRTRASRLLSTLAALVLSVPFLRVFFNAFSADTSAAGIAPLFIFLDAFASSLLLFVLAGDPTAAHGLAHRPVLEPLLAVAFVVGLLVWIERIRDSGKSLDTLLLAALVIGVLPSALVIEPPVRYPDLQRAAMAFPAVLVVAAGGVSFGLRLLRRRITFAG